MEKSKKKGQAPVYCVNPTRKKMIRGLGFIIFVIGAYFILTSFFGRPIIGYAIEGPTASNVSFAGIVLEIIGVVLMVIKLDSSPMINQEGKNGKRKEEKP